MPQEPQPILSPEQIDTFRNDGVLVVDHVISPDDVKAALTGLHDTLLQKYNVDTTDLENTGHHLTQLSSTNGSGGVLDIYYEPWQIQLFATNPKLFRMTTELWKQTYDLDANETLSFDDISEDQRVMWHPYGSFDYRKGYMYLDRIGYRLPTQLAYDIAEKQQLQLQQQLHGNSTTATFSSKKKKVLPMQRSLTPHFDCCPSTMYKNTKDSIKWRPIQCFISLTDTLEPNHGGFEAVKGFHHEFHAWSQQQQQQATNGNDNGNIPPPAPCIGEYSHLRPKEDHDIYQRIQHIPVSAGSAVFWDNRIPHANAYRHVGTIPRAVVYCSFLPDVPINRRYVQQQLQYWKEGRLPSGNQWIDHSQSRMASMTGTTADGKEEVMGNVNNPHQKQYQNIEQLLSTPFARRLGGVNDWE